MSLSPSVVISFLLISISLLVSLFMFGQTSAASPDKRQPNKKGKYKKNKKQQHKKQNTMRRKKKQRGRGQQSEAHAWCNWIQAAAERGADGWTEQISIRNQRKAWGGIDVAAVFSELLTGFTNMSVKSCSGSWWTQTMTYCLWSDGTDVHPLFYMITTSTEALKRVIA